MHAPPRIGWRGDVGAAVLVNEASSRARSVNERHVLALLRHAPAARADLARLTGLSAQAMTGIVRNLENRGLVRALDPVRGRVGQPSVPLALDPRGAYALGFAIGRRGGQCALVDLTGGIVARESRAWRWPDPGDVSAFAAEACATLARRVPADRLHGLGVSMPWRLWQWHERMDAPADALHAWREHDTVGALERATSLPVRLGNDAASACGAELTYGRGARLGDFAYFAIEFFVGGGLVIDGAVHADRRGRGAAFGSLPVPGRSSRSGKTAQLIDEASVHVLEAMLEADGHGTGPHGLAGLGGRDEPDARAWERAPATVRRWETRAASALATAIVSVVAVAGLDHVIIDGGVPAAVRTRLRAAVATALEGLDTRGLDVPSVVEGSLGPDAAVLGAARLALLEDLLPARQPNAAA